MEGSHFITHAIEGGYSWTLASRMGCILHELQTTYGPRDTEYTILGVEFSREGPQIWYPGGRRDLVIQLGMNAVESVPFAMFQLAHECVHVLSPSGSESTSVLEEGLAAAYSEQCVRQWTGQIILNSDYRYKAAAADLRTLVAAYPDAIRSL